MEILLYFHIAVLWVMTHYSLAGDHLHCHLLQAPFGLVRECHCFRGVYASIMRQKYLEGWKSLLPEHCSRSNSYFSQYFYTEDGGSMF